MGAGHETDAAGNKLNEYIFFGGKRIALVPATGGALYYAEDNLGSSRVMVQSNGTLCYDADFTPFGGEKTQTATCAQNYKFEGKERDTETGNDDFGARYYSWRLGRWLSSDWSAVPVPVPYANLTNPQTLNLYAMVADDPESFADLDGHGPPLPAPGGGLNMNGTPQTCSDFLSCFINAVATDNTLGVGRDDSTSTSGTIGAEVGDAVATMQGAVEAVVGGGVALGGGTEAVVTSPLTVTGVGAAVPAAGVGVAVAGAVVAVHGAATAATGAANLFKAGGNFSSGTKQSAKDAAGGKCQNCGTETTPGRKSQKGVTPPRNEGQTDHIQPKSKGGTNDRSNAQHLCRDCNIKKGDKVPEQE